MNKIICDVCGTSYPETSAQCPICGCARPADAKRVAGQSDADREGSSYNYVRGGRFSKRNVKKRNRSTPNKPEYSPAAEAQADEKSANVGLTVTVILLLLAIVAVVIFICLRVFMPEWLPGGKTPEATNPGSSIVATNPTGQGEATDPDSTQAPTETEATEETKIACTGLELTNPVVELDKIGAAVLLNTVCTPADTTDTLTYVSDNEAVATVNKEGKVIVHAPGQAIITVTCGEISAECRVICTAEVEEPTEEATEAPTEPAATLKLNRDDFTLFFKGETWLVYDGELDREQITWSSEDETIATVTDGRVKAVGPGMTTIWAEYGDEKVSCIVRCHFEAEETEPEETDPEETTPEDDDGAVNEDEGGALPPEEASYSISHTDVTIAVGETFYLTITDQDGSTVEVDWIVEDESICTVSGNAVKGAASGRTMVTVVYNGETFSCIVRVK